MNRSDFKMLEEIFACEVSGNLPFQTRGKKQISRLEKKGLVQRFDTISRGDFDVTINGWMLTDLGRYEYCRRC